MDEIDFLIKILDLGVSLSRKKEAKNFWGKPYFSYMDSSDRNSITLDDYLYLEWKAGGVTGGSCWDDGSDPDPHHSVTGEKEPNFSDLDTVLTNLCPNLSFLEYKKLVSEIVDHEERTEDEYYGNYTEYGIKTVRLGSLFKRLQELQLI